MDDDLWSAAVTGDIPLSQRTQEPVQRPVYRSRNSPNKHLYRNLSQMEHQAPMFSRTNIKTSYKENDRYLGRRFNTEYSDVGKDISQWGNNSHEMRHDFWSNDPHSKSFNRWNDESLRDKYRPRFHGDRYDHEGGNCSRNEYEGDNCSRNEYEGDGYKNYDDSNCSRYRNYDNSCDRQDQAYNEHDSRDVGDSYRGKINYYHDNRGDFDRNFDSQEYENKYQTGFSSRHRQFNERVSYPLEEYRYRRSREKSLKGKTRKCKASHSFHRKQSFKGARDVRRGKKLSARPDESHIKSILLEAGEKAAKDFNKMTSQPPQVLLPNPIRMPSATMPALPRPLFTVNSPPPVLPSNIQELARPLIVQTPSSEVRDLDLFHRPISLMHSVNMQGTSEALPKAISSTPAIDSSFLLAPNRVVPNMVYDVHQFNLQTPSRPEILNVGMYPSHRVLPVQTSLGNRFSGIDPQPKVINSFPPCLIPSLNNINQDDESIKIKLLNKRLLNEAFKKMEKRKRDHAKREKSKERKERRTEKQLVESPWYNEKCQEFYDEKIRLYLLIRSTKSKSARAQRKEELRLVHREYLTLCRKLKAEYVKKLEEDESANIESICRVVLCGALDKVLSYSKRVEPLTRIINQKYNLNLSEDSTKLPTQQEINNVRALLENQ